MKWVYPWEQCAKRREDYVFKIYYFYYSGLSNGILFKISKMQQNKAISFITDFIKKFNIFLILHHDRKPFFVTVTNGFHYSNA